MIYKIIEHSNLSILTIPTRYTPIYLPLLILEKVSLYPGIRPSHDNDLLSRVLSMFLFLHLIARLYTMHWFSCSSLDCRFRQFPKYDQ